jgi:hypothetical protein
MNKRFLLASASILLLSSLTAQAGLYRWVDEAGEVHFSDKVPVAASRKAVSEMNKNGVVQKTVDPEAEALAKLKYKEDTIEREKLEKIEENRLEKIAVLKKRDDYLLSTYENKEEITNSFISKIKLMKGNAAILDAQTLILEKRLISMEKQHSLVKNKSRKETLESKIINIAETISQYKKALIQNKEERTILSKNYKTDLNRYINLTQ